MRSLLRPLAISLLVLAVTGSEALYTDMGHFGRKPIRVSWLYFVMPALLLNYMGQGAMLLSQTPAEAVETVKNPFFYMAPEMLRLPLVLLVTVATIIADAIYHNLHHESINELFVFGEDHT